MWVEPALTATGVSAGCNAVNSRVTTFSSGEPNIYSADNEHFHWHSIGAPIYYRLKGGV